jgi:WD40 repeat protein/serine/threonine protein kinase
MRANDRFSVISSELEELLLEWEDRAARGEPVEAEQLCAGTPELVDELKRLFELLNTCDKIIGPASPVSVKPQVAPVPERLGYYEVRGLLGSGGGGVVYKAWDPFLKCHVAIKCVSALEPLGQSECEAMVARFHKEAEFLGKLDHPNIVPVRSAFPYNRQLYLVMGFMPGGSLCAHVERLSKGDPRQVALLMEKVARAVHHAHLNGIFHRDLKPGNVLIDGGGEPRVADFGLAKLLQETIEDAPKPHAVKAENPADTAIDIAVVTRPGYQPGTPPYMAPEQYDESLGKVGAATDIWALGVILYELLTGQRPFSGADLRELRSRICHADPVTSSIARYRKTRGLERVVRRCLEKDPARRYPSALALANDLAGSRQGRVSRWANRHRRLVMAGCCGLVLAAFLGVSWLGYHQYLANSQAGALHQRESAWNARAKGVDLCQRGEIGSGLLWLAEAFRLAPPTEVDLKELLRLDLGAWSGRSLLLSAVLEHPAKVAAVEFAPDGRTVATVADDKRVRVWNADTGSLLAAPLEHPAAVLKVRFATDGQTLRTACLDGKFRDWSLVDGSLLRTMDSQWQQRARPGGVSQGRGEILWEFEFGKPPPKPLAMGGAALRTLVVSPNLQQTLSFGAGIAQLRNVGDADVVAMPFESKGRISDACLSPTGDTVATAGVDGYVRFWGIQDKKEQRESLKHPGPVNRLSFSTDGLHLASGDAKAVRLWGLGPRLPLLGTWRQGDVTHLTFAGDGSRLASGSGNTTVRLWRLPKFATRSLQHPLADQKTGAVQDGAIRMKGGFAGIVAAVFHPDRQRVLVGGVDDAVRLTDAEGGAGLRVLSRDKDVAQRLVCDSSHHILMIGGRDGTVRRWDLAANREIGSHLPHNYPIGGIAFSPDGSHIATGTLAKDWLRIWDAAQSQLLNEFGPFNGVFGLCYSQGGDALLLCGIESAFLCDPVSGQARELPHGCTVFTAAFHPRDNSLVTGAQDGKIRWWNANEREPYATLQAHQDRVSSFAFSPDCKLIASVGMDRKLNFWHATTRLPVGPPVALSDEAKCVIFSPDGQTAVVGCCDGSLHFVPVPQPLITGAQSPIHWVQTVLGVELDAAGSERALEPEAMSR